jgi:hypothetical protein
MRRTVQSPRDGPAAAGHPSRYGDFRNFFLQIRPGQAGIGGNAFQPQEATVAKLSREARLPGLLSLCQNKKDHLNSQNQHKYNSDAKLSWA